MQPTIELEDDLLFRAYETTRIRSVDGIVNAALKALVEREAARRLARMGGGDPNAIAAPRRRSAKTGAAVRAKGGKL